MDRTVGFARATLFAAALGCGSPAPDAAAPRPVEPSPAIAPQPVSPPPEAAPAPELPRFAQLDIDPEAEWPLRTAIRRSGPVRATRDGDALAPGDGSPVHSTVPVIDPDRDHSPRRPRVACEHSSHRVAVFLDAADLMLTVHSIALLAPTSQVPDAVEPTTIGVRLAPGVELTEATGSADGARRVTYRGFNLRADGWVRADRLDVTYQPTALPDDEIRDAEVVRSADLFATPRRGGKPFARIEKQADSDGKLFARQLGKPQRGHVLIRFHDQEATAVGWIATSALRTFPAEPLGPSGYGHGSGHGSGSTSSVKLVRGTLLVAEPGGVIGVVTADDDFPCADFCREPRPLVKVWACSAAIQLRAESR